MEANTVGDGVYSTGWMDFCGTDCISRSRLGTIMNKYIVITFEDGDFEGGNYVPAVLTFVDVG